VFNLAVLFALYPRFYVIKSAYVNSEYRFLDREFYPILLNGCCVS